MDDKSTKFNPLLILQFKETATESDIDTLAKTARKAFIDGCLICDNRIRIVTFDDNGKLIYNSDM